MNKHYALLGVLTALATQLWIITTLFNHINQSIAMWLILLYSLACVLYGLCSIPLLEKNYLLEKDYLSEKSHQKQGTSFLFLFLFAFSMPILGIVGSFIAIVVATHYPLEPESDAFEKHQVPELPFEPDHVGLTPQYSHGGITAILKHASDMDKRLFAIVTTQNMDDKEAVPILKLALKELDDDVRLLAYSSLDKKETAINKQIQMRQKRLSQAVDSNAIGTCHRQLAEKYWELSYLGLSQGALKHYVLEKATSHAEQSLKSMPSIATQTLLAKIWLTIGNYEQAQHMFELAIQSGVPKLQTYPYLAEIAFYTKQYELCQTYLAHLDDENLSTNVENIRAYWHDEGL